MPINVRHKRGDKLLAYRWGMWHFAIFTDLFTLYGAKLDDCTLTIPEQPVDIAAVQKATVGNRTKIEDSSQPDDYLPCGSHPQYWQNIAGGGLAVIDPRDMEIAVFLPGDVINIYR